MQFKNFRRLITSVFLYQYNKLGLRYIEIMNDHSIKMSVNYMCQLKITPKTTTKKNIVHIK